MPPTRREELRRQFEQLRQEGMSVNQYEMRFSELAHQAIWLVPTERDMIRRFINGLNYGLGFVMTREIASGARFDEVVDNARQLE